MSGRLSRALSGLRSSKDEDAPPPRMPPGEEDEDIEKAILANLWKNHKLLAPESAFSRNWFSFIICLVLVRCHTLLPHARIS
jgi:hypothetical protein